jgi:hypothetical protein
MPLLGFYYNPATMLLGARFASNETTLSEFFHGHMREVRLYNCALSGPEL